MPKGPFLTGIPVSGETFIGREKEVKNICNLLKSGQSVILVSPRRYGKTSIMLNVLKELKSQGYYTAEIDLFSITSKQELAEKIVEKSLANKKKIFKSLLKNIKKSISSVFKNIEFKTVINDYEFILDFNSSEKNENYLIEEALQFPESISKKEKKEFVFAYDEFNDILKLDGETLIKKMRAIFQRQELVTYFFAGSEESLMTKIFLNEKQAFYRFGRVIYLDVLPKEDFANFINQQFSKFKISCPKKITNKILNITNCHPYYTQLICQQIFHTIPINKKEIEEKDVNEGIFHAVLAEKNYFDNIWKTMSYKKYDINILERLAIDNKSPYLIENLDKQKVYQAITALQEKGHIKPIKRGTYIIVDPLLKEYIKLRKEGKIS